MTPLPYTPVVAAGDWLVVSGQVGQQDGTLLEGFDAQLQQAITNVSRLLESQGASLADVVKTTVFLADIGYFDRLNEIYGRAFGEPRPARTTFAVAALPLGALVEIEAWARPKA